MGVALGVSVDIYICQTEIKCTQTKCKKRQCGKEEKNAAVVFFGPFLGAPTAFLTFAGVDIPVWVLAIVFAIGLPSAACYVNLGWIEFFKHMKNQSDDKDKE